MQKDVEAGLFKECLKIFQKYLDTVTVSAAVCHLFKENDHIGHFVGIEPKMKRIAQSPATPDLAVLYDNKSKGIIFEIKWSFSRNLESLEEKIKEIKKYFVSFVNWKNDTGRVDWHDVVLICHPDDSERVLACIKKISTEKDYEFFNKIGFSIWTWIFTQTKYGGRTEELRLIKVYGETRNVELERLISPQLGFLVPDEVLTFLRFSYFVVKEKPPIPYLLNILIVNVLLHPVSASYEKNYEVTTDWILRKSRNVILTNEDYDDQSLLIKRKWIREALDVLNDLDIIKKGDKPDIWLIPTNLFRFSRRSINEIVCEKLVKRQLKMLKQSRRQLPIPTENRKKSRLTGKETKMTDYVIKKTKP